MIARPSREAEAVRTYRGSGGLPARSLPARIVLKAIGEEWQVCYARGSRCQTEGFCQDDLGPCWESAPIPTLVVPAWVREDGKETGTRAFLLQWLQKRARALLVPRLEELAALHGFSYQRAQVRCQRTRWGSCSRRGTISLNAKLLLLEPHLVDYVLLHELCHTVVPNHSAGFWTLVAAYDPQCMQHRRELRQAEKSVPAWAH